MPSHVDTIDTQVNREREFRKDKELARERASLDAWMNCMDAINVDITKANFSLSRDFRTLKAIHRNLNGSQ